MEPKQPGPAVITTKKQKQKLKIDLLVLVHRR